MSQLNTEQREMDAAEQLVDRISAQIRDQHPDPKVVEQAAQRVWQQLSRRGMKLVKEGDALPLAAVRPADAAAAPEEVSSVDVAGGQVVDFGARRSARGQGGRSWWAIAAGLVAVVGAGWWLSTSTQGPLATVQSVDTQLFQVETTAHLPMQVGAAIREGELLRTGRDGGAKIRLDDGSEIEMSPRAELAIDESRSGTTIELERGSVIVHAAQQRNRHLYVQTKDCKVSVTGTIFSVNHGTKGSRVSVIEGEVHVDHSGAEDVLHPGDQVTTSQLLSRVPVEKEIAWSRDFDRYVQLLAEAKALQREIEQRVPHAELRYDSRLLDLLPSDTVLYGAMPNVPAVIGQMNQVVQERVAASPMLAQWWADQEGEPRRRFEEALTLFGELGEHLGSEIAVGIHLQQDRPGMALLAEVRDSAGLQAMIARHLHQIPAEGREHLRLVVNPTQASPEDEVLYVWLIDDLAVVASDLGHLRDIARYVGGEQNPFIGSDFYQSIAALYAEGAEFLVAANLDGVVRFVQHESGGQSAEDQAVFSRMGMDNARHLLMEQKKVGDQTHQRGVLTFEDQREGIMAWLAAPAPMGSLQFVSPNAQLVTAAVFKDPAKLFDEIASLSESGLPAALTEFEQRYGLSVREDFMATIGGELAFALDGPLAPKPAFKVVLEVYDPARFQWALEQAVAEVNRQLAEGEHAGEHPPIAITRREKGGYTYYSIPTSAMSLHYTFAEGYLVLAADPALLDQAIRLAESDYSIADSAKFLELLPPDGRTNVSALVYQDLASLVGPLAQQFGESQMTPEIKAQLQAWEQEGKPSLAYAYGESDRLIFAASSHGDMLTSMLLSSLGLKLPTGMEGLMSFGKFFEEALSGAEKAIADAEAEAEAEAAKAAPGSGP